MIRALFVLSAALLACPELQAHTVTWWENPDGLTPWKPMVIHYIPDFWYLALADLDPYEIVVEPSWGEPCTVEVNMDPIASPYLDGEIYAPNPDVVVIMGVWLRYLPPTLDPVNTVLTGEWHATGFPTPGWPDYCDATNTPITVPVMIAPYPGVKYFYTALTQLLLIQTGTSIGLQAAAALEGPWYTIGKGTNFNIKLEEALQFFRCTAKLSGPLSGRLTDSSGNPLTVGTIDLPYGGAGANPDSGGNFLIYGLPVGTNAMRISKPVTFTDPGTGTNRTENVGIDVLVPANRAPANLQVESEMDGGNDGGPVTPECNCTPWCAIAVGTLSGTATPVYYAGGAWPPKDAPATCDEPVVTVTPPNGNSFTIKPGTARYQNSGPNPASGTWTITTTVCNKTKECSISVP